MNCKIKLPCNIVLLLVLSLLLIASCKKATIPSVSTESIIRIQQTDAYSGGKIMDDGGASISQMGVCWNTSADPNVTNNKTIDSSFVASFTSHITGLTPSTKYYVRAYATNSEGTAYGDMEAFTTNAQDLPTVSTSSLKSVTTATAEGGGDISNDGGIPVTARGVCWSVTGLPTTDDSHTSDGSGAGIFISTLTNLTINTTYFVRAYATNSLGTSYGTQVQFTQSEPVLDQDGNAYSVVPIGTQIWMGENLKVTTFNDGLAIPYVSTGSEWSNTTSPAYCWYNNDESGSMYTYGALYNWYAVNSGKLCPTGWHIPSNTEFATLVTYLGGEEIAGGKLKEAGISHWAYPNSGATNESGFRALPGGGRYDIYYSGGVFADQGYFGYLWSATGSQNTSNAFSFDMGYNLNLVHSGEYTKNIGESVRCIKDSQ